MKTYLKIDTSYYTRRIGKKPNGYGLWAFELASALYPTKLTVFPPTSCDFKAALNWAKETAIANDCSTIVVLP